MVFSESFWVLLIAVQGVPSKSQIFFTKLYAIQGVRIHPKSRKRPILRLLLTQKHRQICSLALTLKSALTFLIVEWLSSFLGGFGYLGEKAICNKKSAIHKFDRLLASCRYKWLFHPFIHSFFSIESSNIFIYRANWVMRAAHISKNSIVW